jgi:nucleoside-diphosphate-sugar epimerase
MQLLSTWRKIESNMRILVTGGAGFIGSHLVGRLVRDGVGSLILLDNLYRGRIADLKTVWDRITFVEGDVRDRNVLARVMQDCDLVYHLAAQSNVLGAVQNMEYSFASNVVGTFNVLQAARQAGVQRMVFTSSREVYGDPQELPVPESAALRPKNAYGASKAAGEMYCKILSASGFETVVLRLANVYGPRDRERVIPIFVDNALQGLPLTLYGGEQILDFVWIDIVVDALIKAGFGDLITEPLNIGSGKGTLIQDLARRVLDVTISSSPITLAESRNAEVSRFIADTTKARQLLNVDTPQDPLFGLADVVCCTRERIEQESQAKPRV